MLVLCSILGCTEGRSSKRWVDFNFWGHQVVAHQVDGYNAESSSNAVDGDPVPVVGHAAGNGADLAKMKNPFAYLAIIKQISGVWSRKQCLYVEATPADTPVPHFGAALTVHEFHVLAARVKEHDVPFVIEPHLRFKGAPGEQWTMFFKVSLGYGMSLAWRMYSRCPFSAGRIPGCVDDMVNDMVQSCTEAIYDRRKMHISSQGLSVNCFLACRTQAATALSSRRSATPTTYLQNTSSNNMQQQLQYITFTCSWPPVMQCDWRSLMFCSGTLLSPRLRGCPCISSKLHKCLSKPVVLGIMMKACDVLGVGGRKAGCTQREQAHALRKK
eukprot:359132-Chlamydomonas_euryale.AAC.3